MDLEFAFASPASGEDKKPVSVPRPSAYSGIGSALRDSYAPAPLPDEFTRLLAKLR